MHNAAWFALAMLAVPVFAGARGTGAGAFQEARQVRELLGEDFDGAKLAIRHNRRIGQLNLKTGQFTELVTPGRDKKFWGTSGPRWSPDGTLILYAYGGRAYVMREDGSDHRRVLEHVERLHSPNWWLDPKAGELCYTYKDNDGKHSYGRHKGVGRTWLHRPRSRKTVKLADFPCDGQLSFDGTHLTEAYGGCLILDVPKGKVHVVYGGRQSCNSSTSPDNTYRIMHLYLPHRYFGIRSKFDKELWKIPHPKGSDEWQGPRWSNHTDFATCMAKYGDVYKPSIIRISDKKVVVLKSLGGSWGVSHLFLSSAARKVGGPATAQEASDRPPEWARQKLKEAAADEDALRAAATYREVAEHFADHELGRQAEKALAAAAFRRKLAAAKELERLEALAERLVEVQGAKPRHDDSRFRERNHAVLARMVELAAKLQEQFAQTPAAKRAASIQERYALPDKTAGPGNDKLTVLATIEAVSKVPDPQTKLYPDLVTYIRYRVDRVLEGDYDGKRIIVVHWGFREDGLRPAAGYKPGMRQELTVDLFDAHEELQTVNAATDANDIALIPYWALSVTGG